jgi:primosomal protein N' (replication factor Y)
VGGYSAAIILDAGQATAPVGLDVAESAVERWLAAAHLVVPHSAGGKVVLVGQANPAAVQALIRFDPVLLASRDLAERAELGLPPITRMAAVAGDQLAVSTLLSRVELATPQAVIGPRPVGNSANEPVDGQLLAEPKAKAYVRVAAKDGQALAEQIRIALATRAAKREAGELKVVLDPGEVV